MRYLISGGGTGGHLFPAMAIADELRRQDPEAQILFVGSNGKIEMQKVPAAGYDIVGLPIDRGLVRGLALSNLGLAWKVPASLLKAWRAIRRFRPDIAIGVGGYASLAALKVAQWMGIPTILQEQNSYAGVTNKLLAAKALKICVAYEDMERFFPAASIVLTGNPVRHALLECDATPEQAREALGLKPDLPTVLVVGGSLGARTINNAMINGLERLAARDDIQVLWQTGKKYCHVEAREAMLKTRPANVKRVDFIDRMDLAYRAATIVVSRAGASSISELQLLGKAAILVPATFVAEDHQRHNAEALTTRGAAVMVVDDDARDAREGNAARDVLVDSMIELAHDSERIAALEAAARRMALPDAAARIASLTLSLLNR